MIPESRLWCRKFAKPPAISTAVIVLTSRINPFSHEMLIFFHKMINVACAQTNIGISVFQSKTEEELESGEEPSPNKRHSRSLMGSFSKHKVRVRGSLS